MNTVRGTMAIFIMLASAGTSGDLLAQTGNDASAGAAGRGVRILPPESPAPTAVTNGQPVQQAPAHAVTPTSAAVPGKQAMTLPILKSCDRPMAKPTLRFDDPTKFDRAFRAKLRGRAVVVDMDTPYPADREAPAPLGAWLNEVKQSGGTVSVAPYCQKGRGFGGFFAKLFGGGPAEPYKAIRRYDAVLHVDAVDQVVTQVEFTPRKAAR